MAKVGDGEAGLVKWLELAHQAGRLHVPNPTLSSKLFWGMVAGTLFWPQIFEEPLDTRSKEELTAEVIATFIQRHLSPQNT